MPLTLEIPTPSDPVGPVVPDAPVVPADPVPGPVAPDTPDGPDAPEPNDPLPPGPEGPDVPGNVAEDERAVTSPQTSREERAGSSEAKSPSLVWQAKPLLR
jgi:hypothetical protein